MCVGGGGGGGLELGTFSANNNDATELRLKLGLYPILMELFQWSFIVNRTKFSAHSRQLNSLGYSIIMHNQIMPQMTKYIYKR